MATNRRRKELDRTPHKVVSMEELRKLTGEYVEYDMCLHFDDTMDFPCLEVSDLYCIGFHMNTNSCNYNSCGQHNAQTITASTSTASAHVYVPKRLTHHELMAVTSASATTCLNIRRVNGETCFEIDEVRCELCGWAGCLDCAVNDETHRPSAATHLGWTLPSTSSQASISDKVVKELSDVEKTHLEWVTARAKKARQEADSTMHRIMSKAAQ